MASDGRQIETVLLSRTFVPSSSGRSQLAGVREALPSAQATVESSAELARTLARPAVRGPVGIESVIGPDERARVNPTTPFPARATVLVSFAAGLCSGWLIGDDTVVTAGHCVHPGGGGPFYPTGSYRIYPGRNGAANPFGSCRARWLASVAGWTVGGSDQHDYGAIKLSCQVGATTGWYGFFWMPGSLTGLPTTVNGYPGDKPLTQWRSKDLIRVTQARRLFYRNDTVGGVSGSPVYYRRAGCGWCAMAVHAYGVYGAPPFSTDNHGTRITKAVFENLVTWREAP